MSGIVESCPGNSTGFAEASSRLNCGRDQYGNDQYICVPNYNKTALVEFCYDGIMGFRQRGNCLEVSEGELFKRSCAGFVEGCPETHFKINTIYKYPACLTINTDYKCYIADPSCPNKTWEFTTEDTWGSSITSFETTFSNTTEKYDSTTLPTNAVPVGAIVGGLVAFLVIIGIVIGFVVWKRRKKRKRTGNTEEAGVELLERRHSRPSDDDIGERQNLANLQNESGSLVNNAAGVSEFTLTDEVSDGTPLTIHAKTETETDTLVYDVIPVSEWEEGRKMEVLGDYSVWKTEISDQFSFLSDDELAVLFICLYFNSGTPNFTDTDGRDILNHIRAKMCGKNHVTSEEAERILDGLKSRGFLWDQDGVDITEDAKDETMYRVIGRDIERNYLDHLVTLIPVYHLFSYTTAVRYLRSQRYTRKSGEKCVIIDASFYDSVLIRRLQMNILTHVTMEDTSICDKVSQTLSIPLDKVRMTESERGAFLEDLQKTGECVQSQGSVQHVKWLWILDHEARPDIVRSCIGPHPHWDIYIINNTAYRKHSKYHDYSTNDKIRLYCLLLADGYMLNVKEDSYQSNFNKIKERYFGENTKSDHETGEPLPDGIIKRQDVITFASDDIRHDVMYAFVTECLVEDSDLEFFLTTASPQVISEYCRSWDYKRSDGERCLYIPLEMYELFIIRLQLDILTHCTVSDRKIHYIVNICLGVPGEILDWDQEARERYVEYAKRGTQTVHHARGMIVGCAGAGKTTLLKRLLGCSDAEIRGVRSTEGLEVHEEIFQICEKTKTLKAKTTPGGGEEIGNNAGQKTLSMFDFGGQCPYYACHQIYLTRRAFYMVVVDASKRLDQVVDKEVCDQMGTVFSGWTYKDYFVFWIKSIHTYCGTEKEGEPDPEVIIVATHWDKNVYQGKQDSLVTSLQYLFPSNSTLGTKYIRDDNIFLTKFSQESPLEILSDLEKHIVDIVCKNRWAENIPKEWAFMEIEIPKKKSAQRIEDIDILSIKMPKNETVRKNFLRSMKWVFTNMPMEFQKAVHDMLRYYHDAGKILYFNEMALQKLIIIDVQWFVDAFKNIITDKLHRKGIGGSMDDWNEYYLTGHLKDSLLTDVWRKKDRDLHRELLEKGRAAIDDDVSKDPQYLLPHKDEILMFMNRLGLIAVGEESHYVPCMNRQEVDRELTSRISGSNEKSFVLLFQFDFLPYFLFYRLVVSCMQMGTWEVLRSKGKPCLYRNMALFSFDEHYIAIAVTETTIQLQVYYSVPDGMLEVEKTLGIQRIIEGKMNEITPSFGRGMKFVRGFICKTGNDLSKTMNIEGHFISELTLEKKEKMVCPLHQGTDLHVINTNEMTKYWEVQSK
ncbi:uncharacterized protein LOC125676214 isoform X1 [Ostrea edulis]|uniref:uncharacterized protein LOC125676214 isoform X1 n=1 Tax=Ostrea edulis TaxID=37623 RepID=UPI0024AFC601|nr:uncharacterized protein LOC125676214 isoform X1 [Ostrea edulis]